jgi:hypothetical protein
VKLTGVNQVDSVIEDISFIGKDLSSENVDSCSVRECLDFHAYDEKEEIVTEGEECISKEIMLKELKQMFQNLETVK